MFHDDPENDNMDLLPYVASIWDLETQFHDHTVGVGYIYVIPFRNDEAQATQVKQATVVRRPPIGAGRGVGLHSQRCR